jgi:hypothetical protein
MEHGTWNLKQEKHKVSNNPLIPALPLALLLLARTILCLFWLEKAALWVAIPLPFSLFLFLFSFRIEILSIFERIKQLNELHNC